MGTTEKQMPLRQLISFDKYLQKYDAFAKSKDPFKKARAKEILEAQAPYPELREGFEDLALLKKHAKVIKIILQDAFSEVLTDNEIKVGSVPFQEVFFNPSARFQKILKEAGRIFKPELMLNDGMEYILSCVWILKAHYGFDFDIIRPYFYRIPDSSGVLRHYRVMYNADFIEIFPNGESKEVTQEDVDELLDNPDNIELWKEKIPPNSFVSKGFVISNMFDVTTEFAISDIKSELISSNKRSSDDFMIDLQETFQSFFKIPDLQVGFVKYNAESDQLERIHGKNMESFLLCDSESEECQDALCEGSYEQLIKKNDYFTIPDVEKYYHISKAGPPYKNLYENGIKSAIFAPIASDGQVMGVLEIVSQRKNELNGVNAIKLEDIMPYIEAAVVRSKIEEENLIDAVIQNECTTIHPSVYWRFREEAKHFIGDGLDGNTPTFQEITFKNVIPLFGQVDISGSSKARNIAIQKDLMIQLTAVNEIMNLAWKHHKLPIYEELIFRVKSYIEEIQDILHTNSEQTIFDFVQSEVNPILEFLHTADKSMQKQIEAYRQTIDAETGSYYNHRKNYDESVMRINKKFVNVLDKRQQEAQEMFPHYFERYKTDGVEHNMYIGSSISKNKVYNDLYLNNLRLWQLQVMCEMENKYYHLRSKLPEQLDVTSLILVYSTALSIRFRMDEMKFDVDGTYNARYEIIKKRIDKSFIKGTSERLTQKGKLSIVYSQKKDELEYMRYIRFLKSKGFFTDNVEIVELQGLQGVTGLKA
ncbi:MAG: GAF domain-containing protein, partial [Flavobacteriaceae bacterium]|nr:GAF domain-containing protein [Flavobacteriaceae bacterium]